jgi:hypothetical protein
MFRFKAASFMAAAGNLERAEGQLLTYTMVGEECGLSAQQVANDLNERLTHLEVSVGELPVSTSLRAQISRAKASIRVDEHGSAMATMARIQELKHNLAHELTSHSFFCVPSERRSWFQDYDSALFGVEVETAFPDATPEIGEAGRCFALARWTACVFHLMRALELALHKWAKELGVTQFNALELENWKNILDAARVKIEALDKLPKSSRKDAELQYYGETRANFLAVKDAWRNHVAHSRERYDEARARSIMNHAKDFMALLAKRP